MDVEYLNIYNPSSVQRWQDFCDKNPDAWFWHSCLWQKFILNIRDEVHSELKSFMVLDAKKVKAACPLILETKVDQDGNEICEIAFDGGGVPLPVFLSELSDREQINIEEFVFSKIDEIAISQNVVRSKLKSNVLNEKNIRSLHAKKNNLLPYGYLKHFKMTQIIDLTRSEDQLWKELRRNHRRNINKEKKNHVSIEIFSQENISKEVHNEYKETHHKASGRVTRSLQSFEHMFRWYATGNFMMVVANFEGKRIGFENYIIDKKYAYGCSAANDPDYKYMPIRQMIEWEAMKWLKRNGYRYYEIGEQLYTDTFVDFPSEKQKNISNFKLGFGGYSLFYYIAEKYYDFHFFESEYKKRLQYFIRNKQEDDKS